MSRDVFIVKLDPPWNLKFQFGVCEVGSFSLFTRSVPVLKMQFWGFSSQKKQKCSAERIQTLC